MGPLKIRLNLARGLQVRQGKKKSQKDALSEDVPTTTDIVEGCDCWMRHEKLTEIASGNLTLPSGLATTLVAWLCVRTCNGLPGDGTCPVLPLACPKCHSAPSENNSLNFLTRPIKTKKCDPSLRPLSLHDSVRPDSLS